MKDYAMASMTKNEADGELLDPQSIVGRCMGNLDLVQRLLSHFADAGRQDCEQLEAALREGDHAKLASVAHRLKGSSATIGSKRMTDLASRIESECKSTTPANLEWLVAEICAVQIEVSKRCHQSAVTYQALLANGGGE